MPAIRSCLHSSLIYTFRGSTPAPSADRPWDADVFPYMHSFICSAELVTPPARNAWTAVVFSGALDSSKWLGSSISYLDTFCGRDSLRDARFMVSITVSRSKHHPNESHGRGVALGRYKPRGCRDHGPLQLQGPPSPRGLLACQTRRRKGGQAHRI